MIHRMLRTCLVLICVLALFLPVGAGEARAAESPVPYIQQMIQYYTHYQELAESEIGTLLDHITSLDPAQGALWRQIMADWSWCNSQMPISYEVLPDGLPEDDSLCIVVLGYGLNADGSMQPELVARLETALRSAWKYPNAYIAVTGGGTAANADITEAEAMAAWLRSNGISDSRLILERKSLSTTYNAVNTYRILTSSYPGVDTVAVVTSDYHVSWGCALFQAVSACNAAQGGRSLRVAGNAVNITYQSVNTLTRQARGICAITGIPYADDGAPAF